MSVYDKVPEGGTFRAALESDWPDADCNEVFAVALNASGRVIKATTGAHVGVLVVRGTYDNMGVLRGPKAGTVVDVMKRGEIVEVGTDVGGAVAGGVVNVITASGAVQVGGTGTQIGHLVEATRLVVNVNS